MSPQQFVNLFLGAVALVLVLASGCAPEQDHSLGANDSSQEPHTSDSSGDLPDTILSDDTKIYFSDTQSTDSSCLGPCPGKTICKLAAFAESVVIAEVVEIVEYIDVEKELDHDPSCSNIIYPRHITLVGVFNLRVVHHLHGRPVENYIQVRDVMNSTFSIPALGEFFAVATRDFGGIKYSAYAIAISAEGVATTGNGNYAENFPETIGELKSEISSIVSDINAGSTCEDLDLVTIVDDWENYIVRDECM